MDSPPAQVRHGRGRSSSSSLAGLAFTVARVLTARDDLDGLRLSDEEQRSLLEGYLEALERDDSPPERPGRGRGLAGSAASGSGSTTRLHGSDTPCSRSSR